MAASLGKDDPGAGSGPIRCGTYRAPPLRAGLLAAHEELYATTHHFAYAVCRTHDGQAWEVHLRTGNIDIVLDRSYVDKEAATVAGEAWLLKQQRANDGPDG